MNHKERHTGVDSLSARAISRQWRSPSPPGYIAAQTCKRCAAFFWTAFAVLLLTVLPRSSSGIDAASVWVGDIQGSGWNARDVALQLTLGTGGPTSARISIAHLEMDGMPGPLEQVVVTCARPQTQQPRLRCPDARISGRFGTLGRQSLRADVTYHTVRRSLDFDIRDLRLADGHVRIEGRWAAPGWTATIDANGLQLDALLKFATPWFSLPEGHAVAGRGDLRATVRGGAQPELIDAQVSIQALTANNAEGTLATDSLELSLETKLQAEADGWRIDASIHSGKGQAYVDPIFADMGVHPLHAALSGHWSRANEVLYMERFEFDQGGIARGIADGELAPAAATPIRSLNLTLEALELPGAYAALMQPFLLDTDFKDLITSGIITGKIALADSAPTAVDVMLQEVTARDKQGKLGIEGLRGRFTWKAADTATGAAADPASHLAWDAANAYGLSGGGAQLDFVAAGKDFRLLQPTLLPVLDGGLFIQALRVRNAGEQDMALRFEGELRPISMPLLCRAFGWPEFAGSLSGRIPEVQYDEGALSVGGTLEASAFGGQLKIAGLEMRDPLGRFPRLKADVVLRGLDLETVTGTFSFGTITGKLDGEILGLELFRWAPVRMDARLYTPADDDSRHLISQRAVKNLSSIGGGGGSVAAALQSGFLRFFENFRYRRLGLSCRLENEVCHMDGVGRAKNGAYYIVQGSGLPRIDVVGHSRRTDWPQLVEQLKAIEESGGPVVQ